MILYGLIHFIINMNSIAIFDLRYYLIWSLTQSILFINDWYKDEFQE
ncbi:hypothetical protein [Clostridium tetani]|nr:hypothetical protein [Clostridium tetani]